MLDNKNFNIAMSIAFILLWGVVVLYHIICNSYNPINVSFLLLYICYVIAKCTEIKLFKEVDEYDD